MSLTTEIQRLRTNINNVRQDTSDILEAIANKGVTVPAGSNLDDCAGLISQIKTGTEIQPIDPSLYKELMYVEVNGTSDPSISVSERYNVSNKLKLDCEICVNNIQSDRNFVVLIFDTFTQYYQYMQSSNTAYFHYDFNEWPQTGNVNLTVAASTWLSLSWQTINNDGTFCINGTIEQKTNVGGPNNRGVQIFGPYNYAYFTGTKFFRCTITDENDNIVCDYVPCKRVSDSKIGVYERINNRFYTSYGNGALDAGPVIS